MAYKILYTEDYNRRAQRFLQKHPDLRTKYLKTMTLLEANPYHPSLRLHKLQGKHAALHSISINLSYRVTLDFLIEGETIRPIDIGDHDTVY